MTSHKRAATELLPTHRDPKLARIMAGDTVVHKDKTTGNGSVLQRWGTLGKDALVLVKDTTNAVLQSLVSTEAIAPITSKGSAAHTLPTTDVNLTPTPALLRDMAPPPVPAPPKRLATVVSDTASTSTVVDSPPSSQSSEDSPTPTPSSNGSPRSSVRRRPERGHILARHHKAQVQEEKRKEAESMMKELYAIRSAAGYTADFDTFKDYMGYRQKLETLKKRDTLSPSSSMDDLRSRTTTPALSRSQSMSDVSNFVADVSNDFLRHALDRARATLKEPKPPKPYTPSLDELERIDRERRARIDELLRPKRAPLPPALPPADDAQVTKLMAKKGVIAKVAKETVSNQDLARLRPGQWLNDEIINLYGAMIMERSDAYSNEENQPTSTNGRGKPLRAWYFTSFFWAKLVKDGYEGGRLAKWTKKFDIFSKDIILIPINHDNLHWTAAAINFRRKRIESYDSMSVYAKRVFKVLREYLDAEHRNKKKTPFDFTGWEDYILDDTPQQENSFDCGVFTCQFLEFISRGEESFNFAQASIPYLRRRMIWEIGNTKLRDD